MSLLTLFTPISQTALLAFQCLLCHESLSVSMDAMWGSPHRDLLRNNVEKPLVGSEVM